MKCEIVLVILFLLGIRCHDIIPRTAHTNEFRLCRVCDNIKWPKLCSRTQVCGNNQTCFTEEYIDSHNRRNYRLGCQPKQVCHQNAQSHIRGRRRQSDLCYQCCDTSDCNWRLCHHYDRPFTLSVTHPTPGEPIDNSHAGEIMCRVCANVQRPELCSQNQTCGNYQTCFTGQYIDSRNKQVYRLGCQPKQVCHQSARQSNLCHQCCDKTDCNWRLCNASACQSTLIIINPAIPVLAVVGVAALAIAYALGRMTRG